MSQLPKIELNSREKEENLFYKILIILSFTALLPLFYTMVDILIRGAISLSFIMKSNLSSLIISGTLNSLIATILPIIIMLLPAFILLYFYSIYNQVKTNRFVKYLMQSFAEFPSLLFVAILYLLNLHSFINNSLALLTIALLMIIFPKFCKMLFDSFDEIDSEIISTAIALGAKNRAVFFKIILPSFSRTVFADLLKIFALTFGLTIPFFAINNFITGKMVFLQETVLSEILKFPYDNQDLILGNAFLLLIVYLLTNITSVLILKK